MRAIATLLLALLLGGAVGVGSALWLLRAGPSWGGVNVGGWQGSMAAGSAQADPYARAVVAARGLLALTQQEAVYFTLELAETGAPLSERCMYRISGGPMPARWWSITAYAADEFLPRNSDDALSFDASRAGEGPWTLVVSDARPDAGGGISTRGAGEGFALMLRLYHPRPEFLSDPSSLPAPQIETIGCLEPSS